MRPEEWQELKAEASKSGEEDDDAFDTTRRLALEEGLFVGMSSGAATFAAMETAREMEKGTLVVILPDRGELQIVHEHA